MGMVLAAFALITYTHHPAGLLILASFDGWRDRSMSPGVSNLLL
jgi:hypothetical protein